MDRRQIIKLVGGTAAFATATAWPRGSAGAATIARVGIIDDGSDWESFRQELHELSYIEGQNIAFEYRRGGGEAERAGAAGGGSGGDAPGVVAGWWRPRADGAGRRATEQPRSRSVA